MSTSDLYRVYRTKASHIAEYRNGWGSAPLLWGYLNEKYLGGTRYGWSGINNSPLWALSKDMRVPRSLRITHAFTFDQSVCPVDRVSELADALEEAGKICAHEQHVNHWASIAHDLRQTKLKARQIGFALSCTSVCDPWMSWRGDPQCWDTFAAIGATESETAKP